MHSAPQDNPDDSSAKPLTIPKTPATSSPSFAILLVTGLAVVLSVASFVYFYRGGMTNVYGDGIAHVNIARKVVDHPDSSLWQRYVQIGTPWLPLQTVLMLPLVGNDWLWRTGTAGSVISMLCFVIATVALYRHANLLYENEIGYKKTIFPALSAAIFALNPSVLYIQSTPMSESVFIASVAVSCWLLQKWMSRQSLGGLIVVAAAMSVATLSRYEAWPIGAIAVLVVAFGSKGRPGAKLRVALLFGASVSLGPLYWFWHNWAIYGNALEFLSGPYSARGIYLQQEAALGWARILGSNSVPAAIALMATTVSVCAGPLLSTQAAVGFIRLVVGRWRRIIEMLPAMLLLVPLAFHTLSVYRGEIQIFPLSALGLLNVRYGIPHMLAVALFAPAALSLFSRVAARNVAAIAVLFVVAQYGYLIWEGPSQLAIYQEGYRNGVIAKSARDRAKLSAMLMESPPTPYILMHTGILGPIVPQGGLRFADIIHEGTIRWHQLDEGIPADVNTIIVAQGDLLDQRLQTIPANMRQLEHEFELRFSVADIRLFKRIHSYSIRTSTRLDRPEQRDRRLSRTRNKGD